MVEREEGVGEEVGQQMHKRMIGARCARMREGVPHYPQQDGPAIWSIPPEEELISHRCWDRGISCLASACTHNLETNSSCNYILCVHSKRYVVASYVVSSIASKL